MNILSRCALSFGLIAAALALPTVQASASPWGFNASPQLLAPTFLAPTLIETSEPTLRRAPWVCGPDGCYRRPHYVAPQAYVPQQNYGYQRHHYGQPRAYYEEPTYYYARPRHYRGYGYNERRINER